jgi:hypothetical protein
MKFSLKILVLMLIAAAPLAAEGLSFDNLRENRWQPEPLFAAPTSVTRQAGGDGYVPPRRYKGGLSLAMWGNPSFFRIAIEPTSILFGFGTEVAYNFNRQMAIHATAAAFAGPYRYEAEEDEEDDFIDGNAFGGTFTIGFRWRPVHWRHGALYFDFGMAYGIFDGSKDARLTHSLGGEFVMGIEIGGGNVRGFIETGFSNQVGMGSSTHGWLRTPDSDRSTSAHLILARGGVRFYF